MPTMTKNQKIKRLREAGNKVKAVYMSTHSRTSSFSERKEAVTTADMAAIDKILNKCMNRLG